MAVFLSLLAFLGFFGLLLAWIVLIVMVFIARYKAGENYLQDAKYIKTRKLRKNVGWGCLICFVLLIFLANWDNEHHYDDLEAKRSASIERIEQRRAEIAEAKKDEANKDEAGKQQDKQPEVQTAKPEAKAVENQQLADNKAEASKLEQAKQSQQAKNNASAPKKEAKNEEAKQVKQAKKPVLSKKAQERLLAKEKYKKYRELWPQYENYIPEMLKNQHIQGFKGAYIDGDTLTVNCKCFKPSKCYDLFMAHDQVWQICEIIKTQSINKNYGQYLKYCNIGLDKEVGSCFIRLSYKLDDLDKIDFENNRYNGFTMFNKARAAEISVDDFQVSFLTQLDAELQDSLRTFLQTCIDTQKRGGMRKPQYYLTQTQIDDEKHIKQYLKNMLAAYKISLINIDFAEFDDYWVYCDIISDIRNDEEARVVGERILRSFRKYPPKDVNVERYDIKVMNRNMSAGVSLFYLTGEKEYSCDTNLGLPVKGSPEPKKYKF